MQTPILSICIPTFNNVKSLNALLKSIYDHNSLPYDQFEVLVSDNFSEDDTVTVCRNFSTIYKNFSYNVNTCNIGAIPNFKKVISQARGEFIWLIGSDDIVYNGILNKLVKRIIEAPDTFFWVLNYSSWLPNDLEIGNFSDTNNISAKKVVGTTNPESDGTILDFVQVVDGYLTAMYSFCIKRSLWVTPFSSYNIELHPFSTARNCSSHIFDFVPALIETPTRYFHEPVILASYRISWEKYYSLFYTICLPHLYKLFYVSKPKSKFINSVIKNYQVNSKPHLKTIAVNNHLWSIFSFKNFKEANNGTYYVLSSFIYIYTNRITVLPPFKQVITLQRLVNKYASRYLK